MSSIHNINKQQLIDKIQEKLNDENFSDYKGRVYVQLNDDGSFDIEFSNKNLKNKSNYVKVPNRLVRDCFADIQNKTTEGSEKHKKIGKWSKSLSPGLLSLFPKVHGKGEEDFQKAVIKKDIKNIEKEVGKLSFINRENIYKLRERFSSNIQDINNGKMTKVQVARFFIDISEYAGDEKQKLYTDISRASKQTKMVNMKFWNFEKLLESEDEILNIQKNIKINESKIELIKEGLKDNLSIY